MNFTQANVIPFYVYNSAGQIVVQIDDTGVTVNDPSSTSFVQLSPSEFSAITLSPAFPNIAGSWAPGYLTAFVGSGPDYIPELDILSPGYTPGGGLPTAELHLLGGGPGSVTTSTAELRADTINISPWNSGGNVEWDAKAIARVPMACYYTQVGTAATSPTTGAETALGAWNVNSDGPIWLDSGRLYRFELDTGLWHNGTDSFSVQVRIRQAVNSLSANTLGFFRFILGAEGSNVPGPFHACSYVKVPGVSDVQITPGLTIARVTGGAETCSLYGDSSLPCRILIFDAGLISQNQAVANTAFTAA